MAGLGRTNISNDLRSCVIDVNANRGNNSSLAFLIGVLNLEEAMLRRNLLTKMKTDGAKRLEWLDLVQDINFEDWSTISFSNQAGARENNGKETDLMDGYQTPGLRENISRHTQGLPNDNITPGMPNDNITPEVGVLVKQQRSDSLTKHIEPHTETMGASLNSINESTRPRLPASPRAEAATTPKRKLSPIESTPTGRQRKLSTTAYNSPKLRGAVETAGGNLIHLEQGRAPDLITGIGLLSLRGNNDASGEPHPRTPERPSDRPEQATQQRPLAGTINSTPPLSTPPRNPESAGQRTRTLSLASSNRRARRGRRSRTNSLSTRPTPFGQRMITEIFLKQSKSGENVDEEPKCDVNEQ